MNRAPEWLQQIYVFDGGEIPYHAARLECPDCNKMFLISLSDKNKDWTPPCFNCQSGNTNKVICQTLHSRVKDLEK